MTTDQATQDQDLLKTTTSRCPECHRECPAVVWKSDGSPAKVHLTRKCPEHGSATVCLSSDARFYWLAKGSDQNRAGENGCGAGCACAVDPEGATGTLGRNAYAKERTVETLSTCLALIEIVDSCNSTCNTTDRRRRGSASCGPRICAPSSRGRWSAVARLACRSLSP